jgi:uncharacterized protein involved in type VI secretion and phage assembly
MNMTPAQMQKDQMSPQERLGGIYRAWCKDNADPEKRGRIKVWIPFIHDESYANDKTSLPWAEYCAMDGGGPNYGFLFIPKIGDTVWVTFINGEYQFPVWVGTWYGAPGGNTEIPEEAKTDYPETSILKTRGGSYIEFTNKSGSESIVISDKNGNSVTIKPTDDSLSLSSNGDMTLEVGGDLNISVGGNCNIKADQNLTQETAGVLTQKAPQYRHPSGAVDKEKRKNLTITETVLGTDLDGGGKPIYVNGNFPVLYSLVPGAVAITDVSQIGVSTKVFVGGAV